MRTVNIIPSKSDAHRALICGALSEITSGKVCKVVCQQTSNDIEATKKCLSALREGEKELHCGESGSTLRFLLPVVAALGGGVDFYPEGRLPERPLSPLYEELLRHGCRLSPQGTIPFSVEGQLQPGTYRIPGNVSSQYISGLLFALPLLEGDSRIVIEGRLESESYVDMTIKTLAAFGIKIEPAEEGYAVPGGQKYRSDSAYIVEGDWSNGCFWLGAGALLEDGICVTGLSLDSLQGDKAILNLLKSFGAKVKISEEGIIVKGGKLQGIDIDAAQIPDMVPILAVLACRAEGRTRIYNAGRLRIKESDRLATVSTVLQGLGAEIEEGEDGLVIQGKGRLTGGHAEGFNDHRIVMMASVASLICEEDVILTGSHAVNKSYPDFFQVLEELGLNYRLERK